MRIGDFVRLPLEALWQQKTRTLLTTLGVVFGSFVLAASLSIGQGVQDTIRRMSGNNEVLRTITVSSRWRAASKEDDGETEITGQMSEKKRARIRRALNRYEGRFNRQGPRVELTFARLAEIADLAHVQDVVPRFEQVVHVDLGDRQQKTTAAPFRPTDADCQRRLVAGRLPPADERAVVVSEFLLYQLGLIDDDDLASALGRTLQIEFRTYQGKPGLGVYLVKADGNLDRQETALLDRINAKLPDMLEQFGLSTEEAKLLRSASTDPPTTTHHTEAFPIVGVLRQREPEEETQGWNPLDTSAQCLIPYQVVLDLLNRIPGQQGIDQAIVVVDRDAHTQEVHDRIKAMGLSTFSLLELVEREQLTYLLIFGGMTCVAAVALLVAALGIANTMLMSVLERTREIGIMKAVGATGGQLQLVFLIEGALIGVVGGGLGLLSAWAASFGGEAWVQSMVAAKFPGEIIGPMFVFPAWLAGTVFATAALVTTLAAVYPARRAARIDPVAALRHE